MPTGMGKNKQVIIIVKDGDSVLEDNEDIVCKLNSHFSTIADRLRLSIILTSC